MLFGHLYVFFEGMFVYTLCLLFYGIVYLTQRCMSYLYILEIIALLFALFANISSHSVSCLFVFGFFCSVEVFDFNERSPVCFSFYFHYSRRWIKNHFTKRKKILLQLMSNSVLPRFSSEGFIESGFTFRSLIHFEFIFCMVLENVLNSLFYM